MAVPTRSPISIHVLAISDPYHLGGQEVASLPDLLPNVAFESTLILISFVETLRSLLHAELTQVFQREQRSHRVKVLLRDVLPRRVRA